MDVYGRVARTLLEMSEEQNGVQVINQKLTQRDIASMVGASREMVSRILKDLSAGGYITIESKSITINEKLPHGW
jgi:CRP/FNR family cyclic AMP-dependent transcriptional regulator